MNKFEKRSQIAYDKKAIGYDDSFEGRFTSEFKSMLLDRVKIESGNNVLDVACGNGRLLNQFAVQNCFNGYGIDISDQMIQQAKLLNPSMRFSTGSCERIPYADNLFDVITVCAAYHHFPSVDRFSEEAYRLMKKGGSIYIAEIYYPPFLRMLYSPLIPLMREGDVKFYSPDEIMKTLSNAGFHDSNFIINGHIQIVSATK